MPNKKAAYPVKAPDHAILYLLADLGDSFLYFIAYLFYLCHNAALLNSAL